LPRVNTRTLWFEDISLVNQGIIDTPMGRITARQAAGMGFFALLAWLMFSALSFVGDIFFRALLAVVVFVFGALIFMWRVKTVPPERTLLLALGLGKKARVRAAADGKRVRKAEKPGKAKAAKAEAPRVMKAQAEVGEPFKVVGVLRDPQFGRPLPSRNYEVLVDGVPRFKGSTDEQGGFEAVYIPEAPGVVNIEVRPEGYVGAGARVEVTVRGRA
jgi:hypothetical protein